MFDEVLVRAGMIAFLAVAIWWFVMWFKSGWIGAIAIAVCALLMDLVLILM